MKKEVLRIERASIRSYDVKLRDIYLQLFAGDIAGIIFDNAKERRLFISILESGKHFEQGYFYINDTAVSMKEWNAIARKTISIIGKNNKLIETLELSENIFLQYANSSLIFVKKQSHRTMTTALFHKFSLSISLESSVCNLTFIDRTIIEILKAYVQKQSIVVLYQLNNHLNPTDIKKLMVFIRKIAQEGITFIILDSYEDELIKHADRFFLISKGKTKGCYSKEVWNEKISQKPFHQEANKTEHLSSPRQDLPVLEFCNLYAGTIKNLSFCIQRGELITIKCKNDYVCRDFEQLIKGELAHTKGHLRLENKEYQIHNNWEMIRKGIGIIEENALENSLVQDMTLLDNIMLSLNTKMPLFWIASGKYKKSCINMLKNIISEDDLMKRTEDLDAEILLKAIYCKWLLHCPKAVICIMPFLVDIDFAYDNIKFMVQALLNRGIAVIIVSTHGEELKELGGRNIILD
ncbi:MAG: hypothetical protein FWE25_07520 [Lachnospiraceae bacterium]|nr:hypothetical protein [Lachnospiraceae bacterium]